MESIKLLYKDITSARYCQCARLSSFPPDSIIFFFDNNGIDNAVRRCLLNKTKPFY